MPSRSSFLALLLILLAAVLVYLPGLTGGFAFDDFTNILLNKDVAEADLSLTALSETAWSGGMSGPLKRPISMLSFALNAATTGIWPMAFKLTNLLVHLLTGVVVFLCARVLITARAAEDSRYNSTNLPTKLALIVVAIWLLHPINLTPVLYVVQRMTSLSALFSFLAVLMYALGRVRMCLGTDRGELLVYVVAPVFIVLGLLSKENAILTVPLIGVTEIYFFRFRASQTEQQKRLKLAYVVGGSLAWLGAMVVFISFPDYFQEAYKYRNFTLEERLLTETRVVWFYTSLILLPRLTSFALFHDDFLISATIVDPISTLFAAVGIVILLIVGILSAKKAPLVGFGILWFLVGHSLESTVMPLELVHEHRNYLPSFGVILAVVGLVDTLMKGSGLRNVRRIISIGVIVGLGVLTALRATTWSDPITLATVEAENHPNSTRSLYSAARIYYGLFLMRGDETMIPVAREYLERAANIDQSAILPLLATAQIRNINEPVTGEPWWPELKRRLRQNRIQLADSFSMTRFVKCHASGDVCPLAPSEIAELYQAAISNETNVPDVHSQLLLDYAVLVLNSLNDRQLALRLLNEAIDLRPEHFANRSVRFEVLLMLEEFDTAEQELALFESKKLWEDVAKVSTSQLESMRSKLIARRSQIDVTTEETK